MGRVWLQTGQTPTAITKGCAVLNEAGGLVTAEQLNWAKHQQTVANSSFAEEASLLVIFELIDGYLVPASVQSIA